MAATADQVAQVRRMAAEPTSDTYSDEQIAAFIEAHPCLDERGEEPFVWNTATVPPSKDDNPQWVATYDLHAATADVWQEKASALATSEYDFKSDDQSFDRSQRYEQAMGQVRYHLSRRRPTSFRGVQYPKEGTDRMSHVGNLAEPREDFP